MKFIADFLRAVCKVTTCAQDVDVQICAHLCFDGGPSSKPASVRCAPRDPCHDGAACGRSHHVAAAFCALCWACAGLCVQSSSASSSKKPKGKKRQKNAAAATVSLTTDDKDTVEYSMMLEGIGRLHACLQAADGAVASDSAAYRRVCTVMSELAVLSVPVRVRKCWELVGLLLLGRGRYNCDAPARLVPLTPAQSLSPDVTLPIAAAPATAQVAVLNTHSPMHDAVTQLLAKWHDRSGWTRRKVKLPAPALSDFVTPELPAVPASLAGLNVIAARQLWFGVPLEQVRGTHCRLFASLHRFGQWAQC